MLARNIDAKITIAGKDVTKDLSPFLKLVTYEDVLSGETDTIELELQDASRLFIADWFPLRGDTLEVELNRRDWQSGGQIETLPLGLFEVDEITNSYPPNVAKIKGNSCPQNSALRQTDESKSWENVKLSQIAADVAAAAGVELFFDASDDPTIQRAEQSELSRMKFLEKLCKDNGLALKFADGKLIIFDEEKYEQQEPISRLDYDLSIIKNFSATATLTEIYRACEVTYKHGKKDEQIVGRFEDTTKTTGKTLKINQKVEDKSEAERLARKKLREKNKDEIKIQLTVVGRFDYLSGQVIELINHGFYSGRYLIERARHKIGGGYEVDLELRKCLTGY